MPALDLTAPAAPSRADDRAASAQRLSTRLLFLIVGIANATWAPLVPLVKDRAGLDAAGLGLLLLTFGVGSLLAMPSAGAAAARLGFRPVLLAGTLALGLALPVLAVGAGLVPLTGALLLFGAGMGAIDCVMNLQAVVVERASGRPMMSGFHGLYSLGCILGALVASGLLAAGLGAGWSVLLLVAGIAALFAAAWPGILPAGRARGSGPALALPRGIVLVLGLLCFVVFLTEGSALDWSALFLIQHRGLDPAWAALGYAAFSVTMTAGRLAGDAIVARLGRRKVVILGGLLAAAGLALSVVVPAWEAALAGYALVGAGCANIVPVLFTAAGRQTAMPESVAVPAVTTLGYAGVLAGPALIGFAAQGLGLPAAFLIVAALLLGVAAAGRSLRV
ncbi:MULTISPECIES: MFS transporter [Methylobacterium]|uniref:MFS transporter n=1 Tax=Methylobacterium longum TaxID=767694 RepID=A0ABT8AVL1_9HYPH|nr:MULTISPECIES: MFS transporter [Methylobacterium]MCJ2102949.1 MFS transporter [Methylobacterium sp. E-046]MDN3573451.1 MFS transporter [Methylobacterium longum]GJE12892.1 Inner membrane protein YbjJ [Methylobacterium longum]